MEFVSKRRLPPQEPDGGVVPLAERMLFSAVEPNDPNSAGTPFKVDPGGAVALDRVAQR